MFNDVTCISGCHRINLYQPCTLQV